METKDREKSIIRTTIIGSIVNIILTVGKIAAGIFGHSAAMLADGVHSLSDFISDVVVIVCVRISSKGKDTDHKYGHGKYETMATLFVSLLLIIVGVEMLTSGISSIRQHLNGENLQVPEKIALWAALCSILLKEILYHYTAKVSRAINSPVLLANAWHHRSDALSSIGSAAGISGAIFLGDKWVVLDPIVCCLISIAIMVAAVRMAIPSLNELLEVSLPEEMENEMIQIALNVEGVEDIHELKTRRNGPSIIIDAHLVVAPTLTIVEAHNISTQVERELRKRFGEDIQVLIHQEPDESAE
ncbi:MAG: cation diffusion facilitator family transporter [Paludibacteraceae bacterium]|nr:cation diffusion facilitator family transporter [Paludibacteraceae bacterium]